MITGFHRDDDIGAVGVAIEAGQRRSRALIQWMGLGRVWRDAKRIFYEIDRPRAAAGKSKGQGGNACAAGVEIECAGPLSRHPKLEVITCIRSPCNIECARISLTVSDDIRTLGPHGRKCAASDVHGARRIGVVCAAADGESSISGAEDGAALRT